MKNEQKMILLDRVLAQINNDYMEDSERFMMLSLVQNILVKPTTLDIPENLNHFFLNVTLEYSLENNLKVIEMMKQILQKLTLNTILHFHS